MGLKHFVKRTNARFHLKYICPHCSHHKRETRDLKHRGKCYWNQQWKRSKYDDTPTWMGLWNYIRLHILRKPIRVCIHGKYYEGAEV